MQVPPAKDYDQLAGWWLLCSISSLSSGWLLVSILAMRFSFSPGKWTAFGAGSFNMMAAVVTMLKLKVTEGQAQCK